MKGDGWDIFIALIGVAVLIVLFRGEPDIADAIRVKALEWAGVEAAQEAGE